MIEKLKRFIIRSIRKKIPAAMQKIALRKLMMLDNAKCLNDLRVPPGNRLEPLAGERKGQYSIRIND